MVEEGFGKRLWDYCYKKGFITKEQFIEAMGVQVENNLEGLEPKLIGTVLHGMGYMTIEQINEVLEAIS